MSPEEAIKAAAYPKLEDRFDPTQAERTAWFLMSPRHREGDLHDRVYNDVRDKGLVRRYKDHTEDWSISIYDDGSALLEHETGNELEVITLLSPWFEGAA